MDIKHFSPYIRLAMYNTLDFNFRFDRVIWDYEIIYLSEGKMKLTINNTVYNCVKGDIIFLKPRIHHILESDSDIVVQPHTHFDFFEDKYSKDVFIPFVTEDKMSQEQKKWFREDILKGTNMDLPPVIRLNNSFAIKDILYRLIDEFKNNYFLSNHMTQALLIQLFTEIVRSYTTTLNHLNNEHMDDLNNIVKYINDNIDSILTLDDLADFANISKWYLSRLFKQAFSISPHKYINQARLKRAKELIQYSVLPIKSIAYQMNFDSQQAFSRWFKQLDGSSPIHYRVNTSLN